jgi:hypothetical protein
MNDDQLDRAVRAADPYRPDQVGHLDGADLIEEIMSSDRAPVPLRRRAVTALAAAAVAVAVIGAFAVASRFRDHPTDLPQAAPASHGAIPDAGSWSEYILKAAEQNPRLLIDEPGWTVRSVYGFAEDSGEIAFAKGKRELEMNWYPADTYQSYYDDRLDVSAPQPGKIDGQKGDVFTYSDSDFALMLHPNGAAFVELRTGGPWTRADFDRVLTHISQVDVQTWLDALPPEIVTPGKINEAAQKILADIPQPPGFSTEQLGGIGTNDPYQFGAQVVARIGCGWIAEYLRARDAGDKAAEQKAAAALRSSHKWKVLNDMNPDGDYPEVFWDFADRIAAGGSTAGYQDSLGCS